MVTTKARLAGNAVRIGGHVLWERVTRPRATHLNEVPVSPEALTPEWLTAALCGAVPGAQVVDLQLGERNDGTTSRRPLTVTYNDAGRAADLPTRLFVKSTPNFRSRMLVGFIGGITNEAGFYGRVRPGLDVAAPLGYHVAHDPRTHRSMFVLEDVAATSGARFCNPSVYVDRAMAESMVRQMARYHGAFWENPRLDCEFRWLQTSEQFQLAMNQLINFEKRTRVGIDRAGALLPGDFIARGDEVFPAAMRSLAMNALPPFTLLHHDVHIGNWYCTADGVMSLHDWQATVKGQWSCDFAYAITSALTIEDRRAWERPLLELYLDCLGQAGGQPPSFDEGWLAYRQQQFHGLIYWLFTIGQGPAQPNMQPREFSAANVERMGHAVADLASLDSLDERTSTPIGGFGE